MNEFWTLRQFSRNLAIDERRIGKALAMLTPRYIGLRAVYPVGDGCREIFRDLYEVEDPAKLPPRERLDHYKAERERLALARASAELVSAASVRVVSDAAIEGIESNISALAETLGSEYPDLAEPLRKALSGIVPTLRDSLEVLLDAPNAA